MNHSPTPMVSKSSFKEYLNTFKLPDPRTFKTEYLDPTIDRERKPVKQPKGWQKNSFYQAFELYPPNYSAYEKKFLKKFDISVLLFLGASFYTKYLDNTNISSAFVSGMKEDIHVVGNELNLFNTFYTIAYAICQIPITLLITRPKFSRYLLLICETVWGFLTLANAFVKTPQQVYVIRFFIGVSEACSFPATYVIFSSFLTDQELFTRAGIYGAFAVAGSASSGVLQTRTRESLSGVGGLEGWRWQFIIDFIITMGVVIYGFFLFPGIPTACKKFGLFTEDDMIFARKRLEKKVAVPQKLSLKSFRETFGTWQFYVGTLLWTFHHSTFYSNGAKLYMKSRPDLYTLSDVTNWDSYMYLIGIPASIFISPFTEWLGKMAVVSAVCLVGYYSTIILAYWNVSNNVLMSAFFLSHVISSGLAQFFYSYIATLCKDNVEKKALVLSFAQAFSYATNAWVIPIQYNMKYSPRFKPGYYANIGIFIGMHLMFIICWVLDHYDTRLIPRFAGHRHLNAKGNIKEFDNASLGTSGSSPVIETIEIGEEKV